MTDTVQTPITDALSTDPAIERRDVPSRVWREMAKLERQVAAAREVINRGVEIMTLDQLGQWDGVRGWLERPTEDY